VQFRIIVFLIGLGAAIQVNVVATIAISELLCLLILLSKPSIFSVNNKSLKVLLLLGGLWMTGILLSDLTNVRPLKDTIKALGAVFLLLTSTVAIFSLLSRRPHLFLTFALGFGVSYALQYLFFPSSVMRSLLERGFPPEKLNEIYFAIAFFPLGMWASGFAWARGYRVTGLLILSSYAALSLSYDRRSIFLVCMLSVFYLMTMLRRQTLLAPLSNQQLRRKTILQIFAVSIALFTAIQIYEYSASRGILGEGAMNKYQLQANNEVFGLASGRLDFFEGIYGALQRPILGYGSYAQDTTDIRKHFAEALGLQASQSNQRGLPGHSHIVGAWLFAGALSLPFWVYTIKILGTFVLRAATADQKMIGYFLTVVLYSLWNIMFSPFSNRIDLAFVIAFAIILTNRVKQRRLAWKSAQAL
jgi:hypothetical protein